MLDALLWISAVGGTFAAGWVSCAVWTAKQRRDSETWESTDDRG